MNNEQKIRDLETQISIMKTVIEQLTNCVGSEFKERETFSDRCWSIYDVEQLRTEIIHFNGDRMDYLKQHLTGIGDKLSALEVFQNEEKVDKMTHDVPPSEKGPHKDDEWVTSTVPKGVKARLLKKELTARCGILKNVYPEQLKKDSIQFFGHRKDFYKDIATGTLVGQKNGRAMTYREEKVDGRLDSYKREGEMVRADFINKDGTAARKTIGHRANINEALEKASSLGEKRKLVKKYRQVHPRGNG